MRNAPRYARSNSGRRRKRAEVLARTSLPILSGGFRQRGARYETIIAPIGVVILKEKQERDCLRLCLLKLTLELFDEREYGGVGYFAPARANREQGLVAAGCSAFVR